MHVIYTTYINFIYHDLSQCLKASTKDKALQSKCQKVDDIHYYHMYNMLVASNSVCNYTVATPDSNSPYLKCLSPYSVTKLLYYSCTYTVASRL